MLSGHRELAIFGPRVCGDCRPRNAAKFAKDALLAWHVDLCDLRYLCAFLFTCSKSVKKRHQGSGLCHHQSPFPTKCPVIDSAHHGVTHSTNCYPYFTIAAVLLFFFVPSKPANGYDLLHWYMGRWWMTYLIYYWKTRHAWKNRYNGARPCKGSGWSYSM